MKNNNNMKERSFYFHFNKPASRQAGKPQISIHYQNTCHIVDNVVCKVKTEGKINKRQPLFVMRGKCSKFQIQKGVGIIE